MIGYDVWYADWDYRWCWMFNGQNEVPIEQCGYATKEAASNAAFKATLDSFKQ